MDGQGECFYFDCERRQEVVLVVMVVVVMVAFTGFMITEAALPTGISWAVHSSYFFHGFRALCVNQFGGTANEQALKVRARASQALRTSGWNDCM